TTSWWSRSPRASSTRCATSWWTACTRPSNWTCHSMSPPAPAATGTRPRTDPGRTPERGPCRPRPDRAPTVPRQCSRQLGHEDRGPGEDPAAQWAPLAPLPLQPRRPLRLDEISDQEPGRDQFTDPVAHGPVVLHVRQPARFVVLRDRKSTRLNSSHVSISYAVFCLKKKIQQPQ